MKQYVGISRDHSGSMSGLANSAMRDYNLTIEELERASTLNGIDTIVSVVSHQGTISKEIVNSSVTALKPLRHYPTPGGSTPLFRSVETLIHMLEQVPDADSATFLVMAVTDGEENVSYGRELDLITKLIKQKQSTDRWTFVFRVPKGYASNLTARGIFAGNIQEWEQTERGFQEATQATQSAISTYYTGVTRGVTSSKTFYADMANVSQRQVAQNLPNISHEVSAFTVRKNDMIRPFLEGATGRPYVKGTGFYQLMKSEKVQDYKTIMVRNQNTGDVYAGVAARSLLQLPPYGTITLRPGNHGTWDIFVQSTSVNRLLTPGTQVMYWRNAR